MLNFLILRGYSLEMKCRLRSWSPATLSFFKPKIHNRTPTFALLGIFGTILSGSLQGLIVAAENPLGDAYPQIAPSEENLPVGTKNIRITSAAPSDAGESIDDVEIGKPKPMVVKTVRVARRRIPVLVGKKQNPIMEISIEAMGSLDPKKLEEISVDFSGTTDLGDLAEVQLVSSNGMFETIQNPDRNVVSKGSIQLEEGLNTFVLNGVLKPKVKLNRSIDCRLKEIVIGGTPFPITSGENAGPQRIGIAVRTTGQDQCHTYRIPGLETTNDGTLIAVYDNRYRGSEDLPGDIDVGMSRSVDGGRNWQPMKVIMDMGNDPKWNYDGVGDPSILVDRRSGRIWVAATWSHGNRSWHGSGPGITPEETGQFMLVYSDDDGLTWSEPVNITSQIKKPEWRFVLQGPGKGITMKDGTLVFPAQFRGENTAPVGGRPSSTLIHSKDRGETWNIGTGVKIDTTEAQMVELGDGSIMINCRDNRNRTGSDGRNGRTVAITRDLGQTWSLHSTDRKALPEPTCMASLIRFEHKKYGPLLMFSNPADRDVRHHMTLKVSNDEGTTWPEKWHALYDVRRGFGYSCLTRVDEKHVGVLYEGVRELYFLKFSIEELLEPK